MKPTDDRDAHPPVTTADDRLAGDLASLRPAAASAALRGRIAAELAATTLPQPAANFWRGMAERLAWAAVGAVAAALALLLLPRGEPAAAPRATVAAKHAAAAVAEPGVSAPPARISEEPIAWSDEGIRFLDDVTPTRVFRRRVVERHFADDGRAEVRVPREDVILLPVALR